MNGLSIGTILILPLIGSDTLCPSMVLSATETTVTVYNNHGTYPYSWDEVRRFNQF